MTAGPQLEKGYVRIANEIIETLAQAGLSGNEYAMVLTVLRESYGFNRVRTLPMSITGFSDRTGISKSSCHLALSQMRKKNLLRQNKDGSWGFEKRHSLWITCEQLRGPSSPLDGHRPAHWTKLSSPLDEIVQPTGRFTVGAKDIKDIKDRTTAPSADGSCGQLGELLNGALKGKSLRDARGQRDLLEMRIPWTGKRRGVVVANLPADECEFFLKRMGRMSSRLRQALQLRAEMKRSELHPSLRRAP